jgi:hypothetical protein
VFNGGQLEKKLIGAHPKGKLTGELAPWLGVPAA